MDYYNSVKKARSRSPPKGYYACSGVRDISSYYTAASPYQGNWIGNQSAVVYGQDYAGAVAYSPNYRSSTFRSSSPVSLRKSYGALQAPAYTTSAYSTYQPIAIQTIQPVQHIQSQVIERVQPIQNVQPVVVQPVHYIQQVGIER